MILKYQENHTKYMMKSMAFVTFTKIFKLNTGPGPALLDGLLCAEKSDILDLDLLAKFQSKS